jgi:hypothetical protein
MESGSAVNFPRPDPFSVRCGGDRSVCADPSSGSEMKSGDIAVVFLSLLGFAGTVECLLFAGRRGEVGGLVVGEPDEEDMVGWRRR